VSGRDNSLRDVLDPPFPTIGGGTDFLSLPSTPINRIANINAGREYARARLQEIEDYLVSAKSAVIGSGEIRKYMTEGASAATNLTAARKRTVDDLKDHEIANKRYRHFITRLNIAYDLFPGGVFASNCSYSRGVHLIAVCWFAVTSTCPSKIQR
jgi:hypothetical protein